MMEKEEAETNGDDSEGLVRGHPSELHELCGEELSQRGAGVLGGALLELEEGQAGDD